MKLRATLLIIVGPTSSGKSDLAVKLAKKFNGEVISADSRQVYKGLNVGTGKITKKEMRGVSHHLLDVAEPNKRFTVIEYVRLAQKSIADIQSRGKLPIICGGTGFYIEALLNNVTFPLIPTNPKLQKELANLSAPQLLARLKKLDPIRAKAIEKNNSEKHNIRRLIRAIEIASAGVSEVRPLEVGPLYNPLFIGLKVEPAELKERIMTRLKKRMKQGMLAEAKQIHRKGLSWKRMHELGLEYRYLALYLQGKMDGKKLIEKLNTEIWHYAKRQMTWFKRNKKIRWFKPDEERKIERSVKKFLNEKI